jgi:ADP-ribose pyrophosphatase YjhB (NUDIX family)
MQAAFPVTSEVILSFEDSQDKRYVLLVQNIPGRWQLPFAYLGEKESSVEAAQRVVREKINLNIDKDQFDFLNVYDNPDRTNARRIALTYFHFLNEVNSILVAKNTIFTTKRSWFEVDKLPKLPFDHSKMVEDFVKQQYPLEYSFNN